MISAEAVVETAHRRPIHLFVSTALDTWATDQPEVFARDFQIDDTCYRRLDPEYFSWLRAKMTAARMAAQSGRLPIDVFNEMRSRYNAIQAWAIERFGESRLLESVRVLDVRSYAPPLAEPLTAALPAPSSVCDDSRDDARGLAPQAVAVVDAIRDKALALGWSHDRLYRVPESRRSANALDGGLVCYLRENRRIGEVTRQFIEIIGPRPLEIRQRFYNPDVEQPWIVRTGTPKEKP